MEFDFGPGILSLEEDRTNALVSYYHNISPRNVQDGWKLAETSQIWEDVDNDNNEANIICVEDTGFSTLALDSSLSDNFLTSIPASEIWMAPEYSIQWDEYSFPEVPTSSMPLCIFGASTATGAHIEIIEGKNSTMVLDVQGALDSTNDSPMKPPAESPSPSPLKRSFEEPPTAQDLSGKKKKSYKPKVKLPDNIPMDKKLKSNSVDLLPSHNQPWTPEEEALFEKGIQQYGRGNWKQIAEHYVKTRNALQVKNHARQYFRRTGLDHTPSKAGISSSEKPAKTSHLQYVSSTSVEVVKLVHTREDEEVDIEGLDHDIDDSSEVQTPAFESAEIYPRPIKSSHLPNASQNQTWLHILLEQEPGLHSQLEEALLLERPPLREVFLDKEEYSSIEMQFNREFFRTGPGNNSGKTPQRYAKIRNTILECWEESKPCYLSKTAVRNLLRDCGDVNAIGRVHLFLEQLGAINYGAVKPTRFKNKIKLIAAPINSSVSNVTTQSPEGLTPVSSAFNIDNNPSFEGGPVNIESPTKLKIKTASKKLPSQSDSEFQYDSPLEFFSN